MVKFLIRRLAHSLGYEIRNLQRPGPPPPPAIPDGHLYRPTFSPWYDENSEFGRHFALAARRTLVSADRCFVLYTLLRQTLWLQGDIWECGVYRGGTAAMFAQILADQAPQKKLYLFDTFAGMPTTDAEKDWHSAGDFADTSVDAVRSFVGHSELCEVREGFIPATFAGLESHEIAFAHIDVDIYRSILDSLSFIWPRLAIGGVIVFDDYGFSTCPGARSAVDKFFAGQSSIPLCLPTGQAIVFKSSVPEQHVTSVDA
jgi:O-methyltransferase